ncbi:helix-turn-helix domain-containing protein [Paenibacillus mesophilus]|uniref:helix-turn-helix domain-containing protein n=1 Tax=Paenibacillus mesophilus TaxID=2582849 RepID=UPI00110E2A86|nr:helix-turn-helix domain-containing protein [Paenibacillus mesophilus]TMV49597.1 helix-turn-helix domain-containing protein [Paenibacillus mesophilus]
MSRRWTKRLLLSYLPVFFIISSSLMLITYVFLSEMSRKSAMKSNDALLRNVMQSVDAALSSIDNIMLNDVMFNERAATFFSPEPGQHESANLNGARFLTDLQKKLPMVDSAYLYRATDGTVMTNARLTTLEQFGDQTFIQSHLTSLNAFRWTPVRTYTETAGSGNGTAVISLVRYGDILTKGLLVVNVNAAKLQQMIDSMYDHNINVLSLVDSYGNPLLLSGAENEAARDQVQKPNIVKSAYTGWEFRGGIRNGGLFEIMSSTFSVWLAVGVGFIAFGVIWVIIITMRHAKPLQRITNQLLDYSRQKSSALRIDKGTDDEFFFISSAIDDLLETSGQLQEQNQINLVYRKQVVFKELLDESASKSYEEWCAELEPLYIRLHDEAYVVAIAEIDQYADFCRKHIARDQFLLKHVLRNVLHEMAESAGSALWTEWIAPHQLGMIVPLEPGIRDPKRVTELCRKIRQWVEQNLNYRITVSIGPVQPGLESLSASYKGAWAALQYKTSFGDNRVIEYGEIGAKPHSELFKHLQHMRSIGEAYRMGDRTWADQLKAMFQTLRDQLCSKDDLRNLMQYFLHQLDKEMSELPVDYYVLWTKQTAPMLQQAIEEHETIDHLHGSLYSLLLRSFEEMGQMRENRSHHQIIQQVKSYIEEHYSNPNLSLTHLSDEFGISPTYISKLFKEELGEKFIDYVTKVRMNRAKELLTQTNETIQNIAATVGYPYTLTFIRGFKKMIGTTPGSFRKHESS